MNKLSLCLSPFLLFFPVLLWAAEDGAALPAGSILRGELVRFLREEGFNVEELPPLEYGGRGTGLAAAFSAPENGLQEGAAQGETGLAPDIFILGVSLLDTADEQREQAGQDAGKFPFALETALSFLKTARENQLNKRVAAAFLEDAGGDLPGLEDLAASLDYPENAVLVYLDFAAPPEKIVIHHAVQGGIAPLAIVQPLSEILKNRGIPYSFDVPSHELYNLGLAEGPAVLERARSLEIPAILLTAAGSAPQAGDSAGLAEALAEYAAAVRWEMGGRDTHYSLFAYGGRIFFLSERLTLILILFLAGTGIAFQIRRFLPRRPRRLPVITAAAQQAWQEEPLGWSDHCARLAIFLAILGILGGTFLDLSCAPAFIWVLAFTILGAELPFAPVVFICALLSPFKGAVTIFQTLQGKAFTSTPASLDPGIYLLLAFLVLPFLFLVLRGILLIVENKNSRVSAEELEKSGL
ncbi:MAG: hypothetical protein LBP81_08245 [Treponema sp.]|nr:hypothetical protein [Treponema sp.]